MKSACSIMTVMGIIVSLIRLHLLLYCYTVPCEE